MVRCSMHGCTRARQRPQPSPSDQSRESRPRHMFVRKKTDFCHNGGGKVPWSARSRRLRLHPCQVQPPVLRVHRRHTPSAQAHRSSHRHERPARRPARRATTGTGTGAARVVRVQMGRQHPAARPRPLRGAASPYARTPPPLQTARPLTQPWRASRRAPAHRHRHPARRPSFRGFPLAALPRSLRASSAALLEQHGGRHY